MRNNCETCRHYTVTGHEDFYDVGTCSHPAPLVGGAMVEWDRIPEWTSCYQWQKRQKPAKAKAPEPQTDDSQVSGPAGESPPPAADPAPASGWRRRKPLEQEIADEIARRKGGAE